MLLRAAAAAIAALCVLVPAVPAQADYDASTSSIIFDFTGAGTVNKSLPGPDYTTTPANNTSVGTNSDWWVNEYMNQLLDKAQGSQNWSVSVQGSETSGSATSPGYTGDGHVVYAGGKKDQSNGNPCSGCKADTLSTKDGTPYIMTSQAYHMPSTITVNGVGNVSTSNFYGNNFNGHDAIKMAFTGGVAVSSLSFDFEIFPCYSGSQPCGTYPDFTFLMLDGSNNGEAFATISAVAPGSNVTTMNFSATSPAFNGSTLTGYANGTGTVSGGASESTSNKYSDASNRSNVETSPQLIGTMTFDFFAPVVNPTLYFIDWPATVAVTNIDWGLLKTAPEPGSLMLLGTALAGMAVAYRRKEQRRRQRSIAA